MAIAIALFAASRLSRNDVVSRGKEAERRR